MVVRGSHKLILTKRDESVPEARLKRDRNEFRSGSPMDFHSKLSFLPLCVLGRSKGRGAPKGAPGSR